MRTSRPTQRRALAVAAMLTMLVTLGLLAGSTAHARRHSDQRHCRRDKQCRGGECNAAHQCCAPLTEEACGTSCCHSLVESCCGSACVDTTSNTANCGACGNACSAGQTCENGVCTCEPGRTDCGGVCIDTRFNDANCGTCGHACPSGQECIASGCVCAEAGDIVCNGTCIDGLSDRNNCGMCGRVCPEGQSCVAGQCQAPCDLCHELVNNVCVSKDCGVNRVCAPQDGFCYVTCEGNRTQCCSWNGIPHGCLATDVCGGGGCCNWQLRPCESTDGTPYASCCDHDDVCVQTVTGRASCCKPGSRLPKECLRQDGWALPALCCDFTYPKDYPGAWE